MCQQGQRVGNSYLGNQERFELGQPPFRKLSLQYCGGSVATDLRKPYSRQSTESIMNRAPTEHSHTRAGHEKAPTPGQQALAAEQMQVLCRRQGTAHTTRAVHDRCACQQACPCAAMLNACKHCASHGNSCVLGVYGQCMGRRLYQHLEVVHLRKLLTSDHTSGDTTSWGLLLPVLEMLIPFLASSSLCFCGTVREAFPDRSH